MRFKTLEQLKVFLIAVTNYDFKLTLTPETTSFAAIIPRVGHDYGFELKCTTPGDPFRARFYFTHRQGMLAGRFSQEIVPEDAPGVGDNTVLYLGEADIHLYEAKILEVVVVDYPAFLLEDGSGYILLEDGSLLML